MRLLYLFTRHWQNADKLVVGLRDILTSVQTKNSLHSTFVHYKFSPLIRISYAEMDSRIQRRNKHFELPRCRCVSAKRTPESPTWSSNLIWVHTVVFTCSCTNFFQRAYHTTPTCSRKMIVCVLPHMHLYCSSDQGGKHFSPTHAPILF